MSSDFESNAPQTTSHFDGQAPAGVGAGSPVAKPHRGSSDHPDRLVDAGGTVKWFDPKKGFGFIMGPDGQDIFAHFTKIEGDGFRVLSDGALVRYSAEKSEKGWNASKIVRVSGGDGEVVQPKRTYARTPRR